MISYSPDNSADDLLLHPFGIGATTHDIGRRLCPTGEAGAPSLSTLIAIAAGLLVGFAPFGMMLLIIEVVS